MDPSTFHPFPRLPAELQLQVWEEACLPSQLHQRGLHYFRLDNDGKMLIPFGWNQETPLEQPDHANPGNKSAYLWHRGLWTACKASRATVMKHSRINAWKELQEKCDREGRLYFDLDIGEEDVHPGLIVMGEGHDTWYLMVYPTRDIFCLTFNNWELVKRAFEKSGMYYSFPFLGIDWTSLGVENLALEFDPSWNHAFPDNIYRLRREESPRGLLGKLIDERVYRWSDIGLWLVDKSVHWRAKPDRDYRTVFYDCDGEYVEIGWGDTYSDHSGIYGPVTSFIRKLARLCDQHYTDLSRGDLTPGYHEERVERFSAKASVRLLVRRDNRRSENDGQVMGDENENMVTEDGDALTDDENFWIYMG